eukprot:c29228_g1_i1 orf=59-229(+)
MGLQWTKEKELVDELSSIFATNHSLAVVSLFMRSWFQIFHVSCRKINSCSVPLKNV